MPATYIPPHLLLNPPPYSPTTASILLPALHHAVSGSAGTAIATWITYSLSLVTTRLQAQGPAAAGEADGGADAAHSGIGDVLSWTFETRGEAGRGGLRALYTGLAPESVKSVLDSFLFFMFYEWLRARRLRMSASRGHARGGGKGGGLGALEELAVGIAAGACSRLITTPVANIVTRKQTAALVDDGTASRDLSVSEIAAAIRKEKDIRGFWSGYSATLVLTLNPSITFFLQHYLSNIFLSRDNWGDLSPEGTFLSAAVSKAIASTITYPFQTAKTRLQAGAAVDSKPKSHDVQEDLIDVKSDSTKQENVGKQVESKLEVTRAVQKIARQSIFGTIAHMIRTEGVASLYDGIQGELLKGFFSHGITMVAKDLVHKFLFRLYLVMAGMLGAIRSRRERHRVQHLPRALRFRNVGPEP